MRTNVFCGGILAACLLTACGGGGGGGSGATGAVGAASAGAGPATFHTGALPAATGALTVSVPATGMGINGGTSSFEITASAVIVTVYASVEGQSGYWEIPVPPGSDVANVLLTFAQELGLGSASEVTVPLSIIFEVADALGDISAPQATPTTITVVGTGAVEVALTWNVSNDLDLHVVDPTGNEVYYDNPYDSTGAIQILDLDSNAGCIIDGVDAEHAVWPAGKAPHGTYTVRVDNFDNCQTAAASYTVTVEVAGQAPQTFVGKFEATDMGDFGGEGDGVTITTFTY